NAVLLVGDFFKNALDSGKIDAAAQFPGAPPRAAPRQEVVEEVIEEGGDMQQDGVPPPQEVPAGPVIDEQDFPQPDRRNERATGERAVGDRDAEIDRQIREERQQQIDRQQQYERQQIERQFRQEQEQEQRQRQQQQQQQQPQQEIIELR
ncbi:MAG TPA: hypothetical protein VFU95_14260, partial [Telluria sp.]|nr:hypothetical protein [Telluria sp.]